MQEVKSMSDILTQASTSLAKAKQEIIEMDEMMMKRIITSINTTSPTEAKSEFGELGETVSEILTLVNTSSANTKRRVAAIERMIITSILTLFKLVLAVNNLLNEKIINLEEEVNSLKNTTTTVSNSKKPYVEKDSDLLKEITESM